MNPELRELYDPMLERDEQAIEAAAAAYAGRRGAIELFHAVSRFAVLAYNPSQHGKHALLAASSAWELRERLGTRWHELLTACAVYAANARLPWSEPPLLEPPPLEGEPPTLEEIRAALERGDRSAAERWLAGRIDLPGFERDLFEIAALDLRDLGHPFLVTVAAWKISRLQDRHPSFAVLRAAVLEWCARRDDPPREPAADEPGEDRALAAALLDRVWREGGSLEALHDLALFDAALEAEAFGAAPAAVARVRRTVETAAEGDGFPSPPGPPAEPIYALARDYGAYLKAHAIAERLSRRFPDLSFERLVAAAGYNLRSSSFDQWSFA
ncbi:MAG TPA: hypothetical protein VMS56_02950 [Thermoanaerobaculia bacterium]|nr:hypothetical protein [Thermoanaerobaculia bacterium]